MTRHVLVVDDEPDMRFLARRYLERAGWSVEEATSGEEALERCRARRYDAIVLDQRMTGMTGIETAGQLRELGIDRPVALFSAYLDPEVEQEAQALGLRTIAKADVAVLVTVLDEV